MNYRIIIIINNNLIKQAFHFRPTVTTFELNPGRKRLAAEQTKTHFFKSGPRPVVFAKAIKTNIPTQTVC